MNVRTNTYVLHPTVPARWAHGFHPDYGLAWRFLSALIVREVVAISVEGLTSAVVLVLNDVMNAGYIAPGLTHDSGVAFVVSLLTGLINEGSLELRARQRLDLVGQAVAQRYGVSRYDAALMLVAMALDHPLIVSNDGVYAKLSMIAEEHPDLRVVRLADYQGGYGGLPRPEET